MTAKIISTVMTDVADVKVSHITQICDDVKNESGELTNEGALQMNISIHSMKP